MVSKLKQFGVQSKEEEKAQRAKRSKKQVEEEKEMRKAALWEGWLNRLATHAHNNGGSTNLKQGDDRPLCEWALSQRKAFREGSLSEKESIT